MDFYTEEEIEKKRMAAVARKEDRERLQLCKELVNMIVAKSIKKGNQRKIEKWRLDGEMKQHQRIMTAKEDSELIELVEDLEMCSIAEEASQQRAAEAKTVELIRNMYPASILQNTFKLCGNMNDGVNVDTESRSDPEQFGNNNDASVLDELLCETNLPKAAESIQQVNQDMVMELDFCSDSVNRSTSGVVQNEVKFKKPTLPLSPEHCGIRKSSESQKLVVDPNDGLGMEHSFKCTAQLNGFRKIEPEVNPDVAFRQKEDEAVNDGLNQVQRRSSRRTANLPRKYC